MWNRIVTVQGHLRQQAVGVDQCPGGGGLSNNLLLECRIHPDGTIIFDNVEVEENIGLLVPTSSGGIIADLAVMMMGKTVVNLNYTASLENLKSALDQAEIRIIVTSQRFITKLSSKGLAVDELFTGRTVLYLEDVKAHIALKDRIVTLLLVKLLPAFVLRLLYFKRVDSDRTRQGKALCLRLS